MLLCAVFIVLILIIPGATPIRARTAELDPKVPAQAALLQRIRARCPDVEISAWS